MPRKLLLALGLLVVLIIAGGLFLQSWLSTFAREEAVSRVEAHFNGRMDVDPLTVTIFPVVSIRGTNLTLHTEDQLQHPDEPPLITIGAFQASTSVLGLLRGRIDSLALEGLLIQVPPDDEGDSPSDTEDASAAGTSDDAAHDGGAAVDNAAPVDPEDEGGASRVPNGLKIGEIVSTNARLVIAPDEPDGTPLEFEIMDVRLEDFSLDAPAHYEATLTNPRPRGLIESEGEFGPWNRDEPRLTPLGGTYTLSDADMSVFGGIGGRLTSSGRFTGVLESIAVTGEATIPDFLVDVGGHPMRLETTFETRVDGTSGNTYLDRVSSRLGESPIEATGEVAGTREDDGKTVRLDVTAAGARLEDFIYLVVTADESPMFGTIDLETTLELPPGDVPVPAKLRLDGTFAIRDGGFTSDGVQQKVDELSRRGQGEPENDAIRNVMSDFDGRFTLRDGVLRLPQLQFSVSGADVRLAGTYTLQGEQLAFEGDLRLRARVSETTTGFKSFLLRAIDPLLARDGAGTLLPIRLGGTVAEPEFGVRMFGG